MALDEWTNRFLNDMSAKSKKDPLNYRTGKLKSEEEPYTPKQRRTREAAKIASPSRLEVVKDTGAGRIPQQLKMLLTAREAAKAKTPKINTDDPTRGNILSAFTGKRTVDMTKSTAADEKTRLYETNDSLLSSQELLRKYQYVAAEQDMDYDTLRRAVNKGMDTIGRVLKENNDMTTYRSVAELQTKLQSRLKSGSFAAGFLDSVGGDLMSVAAKISGNQIIREQAETMRNQLEQAKANNQAWGTAGALTGEFAKAGAGYATIGKKAEEKVLKTAAEIGLTGTKAKAAAALLGQQAADTVVNTPITVAAGLADGKNREEIARDVRGQMAMDAAFNVGLGALEGGAKYLRTARQGKLAKGLQTGRESTFTETAERAALQMEREKGFAETKQKAKKIEDAQPGDVTSPSVTSNNATLQSSANNIYQNSTNVNTQSSDLLEVKNDDFVVEMIEDRKRNSLEGEKEALQDLFQIENMFDLEDHIVTVLEDALKPYMEYNTSLPKEEKKKLFKKLIAKANKYHGEDLIKYTGDAGRKFEKILKSARTKLRKGIAWQEPEKMIPKDVDYSKLTAEEQKNIYDARQRLQKMEQKVREDADFSKEQKSILKRFLDGKLDEEAMQKAAGEKAEAMRKIAQIRKEQRNVQQAISKIKEGADKNLQDEMKKVVGDVFMRTKGQEGWKDPHPLLMARETQERILDMVAPTKEKAEQLRQYLFESVHESERQRTLFMQEYRERLAKTGVNTRNNLRIKMPDGDTMKTSESGLVQWLGENRFLLQQMESRKRMPTAREAEEMRILREGIAAVEKGLTGEQLRKINNGINVLRDIYEEIHPMINKVLIRNGFDPIGYIPGYFPHMQFDDPKNLIDAAAKKLGLDFSSKELPMDIAGRTENFRPGKKWSGNLLKREGTQTDHDAFRAFDLYIDNISDVIYHTDNIKRLRAFEDYLRGSLSDKGIRKRAKELKARKDLTENEREVLLQNLHEDVQDHALQNYVNNIRLYTDLLAGKKHASDRNAEKNIWGRKFYKVATTLENRVTANMVGANIGSAMTNIIPITQGMGAMRMSSNIKGLKDTLVSRGADELTAKSAFLTTRKGTDLLYQTRLQKLENGAFGLMELMDTFSTQTMWRSRYYDNLKSGLTEEAAIKEADRFCRGLFAGRSKGAMPTIFSAKNPVSKTLTMFQLEVNNQISYLLKDVPSNARGNALRALNTYVWALVGAYGFNEVYEKLTGRRSALDPAGYAREAVGDWTGKRARNLVDIAVDTYHGRDLRLIESTEKKDKSEIVWNAATNIGGQLPFAGGLLFDGGRVPIQSAIPGAEAITRALVDHRSGDASAERTKQVLRKELDKPLWYLVAPAGGGQIRKSWQGIETMLQGGSYNQTKDKGAELQFAVDQDSPAKWIQAAAFGKWATPEAREYLEKNNRLGVKQTETYEKLVAAGVKNTHAFHTINRIRQEEKADKKRMLIRGSLLNGEQKAILYRDFMTDEGSTDAEILDVFEGTEQIGAVVDCLSWIAEYDSSIPKRSSIANSGLSDRAKEYIYLQKLADDREKEQKRIDAFKNAGMKIDDFLRIKNKFSQIDESVENDQKYATMKRWMKEQGYSQQQWYVVDDAIGFWITIRLNQKKAEKARW